jgi:PKD repeat protein
MTHQTMEKNIRISFGLKYLIVSLFILFLHKGYAQPIARIFVNGQIRPNGAIIDVCPGATAEFRDTSLNSNSRNWQFNSATPSTSSNQISIVTFNNTTGTDTVRLIAINGSNRDTIFILVRRLKPSASFTFSGNTCSGTNIVFTNSSTGRAPLSYQWRFGLPTAGAPPDTNGTNPVRRFNAGIGNDSNLYNIRLITTDILGCKDSLSAIIYIRKLPNVFVIADPTVSGNFINIPNIASPNTFRKCNITPPNLLEVANMASTTNISHRIFWGDNTDTIIGPFTSNITHNYVSPGLQNMRLIVTNQNGCIDSARYVVFVGTNPAVSMPAPPNTTGQCVPKSYTFAIGGVASNSSGTTYRIESNDIGVDTIFNHPPPSIFTKNYSFNSCGFTTPNPYPNSFFLKITAINPCGSTTQTVEPIQLSSKPKADFSRSPDTMCVLTNITFTNTSTAPRYIDVGTNSTMPGSCDSSYFRNWNISPASGWTLVTGIITGLNQSNTFTLNFNTPGIYFIRLIVLNPASACGRDTIVKTICISPIPSPQFSFRQVAPSGRCAPTVISIQNNSNTLNSCDTTRYTWTFPGAAGGTVVFDSSTNLNSVNPVIRFIQSGTYTIRLTAANRCSTVVKDTTITIKGPPTVVLPTDRAYCDSITLAFSITNLNHRPLYTFGNGDSVRYKWTILPAGLTFVSGSDTSANPSVRFLSNLISPLTYTVISQITNECGIASDTQLITINQPILAPSVRDTFSCGPNAFILTGLLGANGNTLRWYADSTSTPHLLQALFFTTPSISSSRSFFVSSYNTSTGCESRRMRLNITIYPLPAAPSVTGSVRCGPSSVSLIGTAGSNGNSIRWYNALTGGVLLNTGLSFTTPLLSASTTYYVTSFNTTTGCETGTRIPVTVTINPLPTVNAGNDTLYCNLNTNFNLPLALPAGGVWRGVGVIDSVGGLFNPTIAGLGIKQVIYRYTNPTTGCSNNDTILINVIIPTIPNAGNDTSLCRGSQSIQLAGSPLGGTWTGTNVSSGGLFNPSVAGVFQLVYSIGAGSCLARDTIRITVNELPLPNISANAGVCPLQNLLALGNNANSTIPFSFRWRIRNFRNLSNAITTDSTSQNLLLAFPDNTTTDTIGYRIQFIITSTNGCTDSISRIIVLNRRPVAAFSLTGAACGPTTISVSNSTTNNPGSWLWRASSIDVGFSNSTVSSPILTFPVNNSPMAILYSIEMVARISGIGATCSDSTTRPYTIYPKPNVSFAALPDTGCTPLTTTFNNTSNPRNGENINTMTFEWSRNNNIIASTQNISAQTYSNPLQRDSIINVRLIGTTQHGCKDTANKNITVYPNPKSEFTASLSTSCAPFLVGAPNVQLVQYPNANDSYTWNIFNGNKTSLLQTTTGTAVPSRLIATPNDSLVYQLITRNVHNCRADTVELKFRTIPNPVAAFSMNIDSGCTPLAVVFTNNSSVGTSSQWFFGNGNSSTSTNTLQTFINPSNVVDSLYIIKLVITAGGTGCRDSILDTVRVFPRPSSRFSISQPSACPALILTTTNTSLAKSPALSRWAVLNSSTVTINDSTIVNPSAVLPDNQSNADSSYVLRLRTISVNGCVHDTTRTFIRLRRPLVQFTIPPSACGPFSFTPANTTNNIPDANLNWNWTINPNAGTSIITPTIKSPVVNLPVNSNNDSLIYTIRTTATRTDGGCIDTLSRRIIIYPKPNVGFTALPDTGCTPLTTTFNNTSDPRNGENINTMTFEWRRNNNIIASTQNISAQTYSNPLQRDSIINIRLIGTTQHGCKDTVNKNIIIRPNAKAHFTFNSDLGCAPFRIGQGNIQTASFPAANSGYEWYINDSLIGTNFNFPGYTINRANDSIVVKLKAISIAGCKNDSFIHQFKTIQNPTPLFRFTDSIGCSPFTYTMINQSLPSTGVNYQWIAGSQISNSLNPTFTQLNLGTLDTTVRVRLIIIVGNTGCKDSLDKFITVKPLPRPDFNINAMNLCYPNGIFITNTTTTPPPIDMKGYKWKITGTTGTSIANDTTSGSTTITIPDNQTGSSRSYSIQLVATTNFGCKDSVSKNILTPSRPIASFNFNLDSICSDSIASTINTTQFGLNYVWKSLSNNLTISVPSNPSITLNYPKHRGLLDSIYWIRLIAQNSNGCLDSVDKNIVVHPKPIAEFLPDTNMGCSPLTVNFTNNTIASQPISYIWQLESGILSSAANPAHTFNGSRLNDTTYSVRLIATSKHGCKDTTLRQIVVKSSAIAVIKATDSVYCMSTTLRALAQFNNQSYGDADTFEYNFGDGTFLITNSDTLVSHFYTNEGIYNVKLTAKNICNTSKDSVQIKVLKEPAPGFVISDTIGCGPLAINFTNTTNNFEANYYWDFGNGQNSNLKSPLSVTFIQSKIKDTTYVVKLTVSNKCGLKAIQDTIRVLPMPVASFLTSVDSGCSPLPVAFINTTTGLPNSIKWRFGNGDTSNRFNPTQVVYRTEDSNTVYTVKLIAQNICGIDSTSRQLLVKPNTVRSFFQSTGNFGCAPYTVSFTDKSEGGTSLSWNFGNGESSGVKNPTVTFNTSGSYTVSQYVNNGCSYDTSIMIINVQPSPSFSISKDKNSACVKESIKFNANLIDSGSIMWYFSTTDSSNQFNPIFSFNSPGKKLFKVVLKSLISSCTTTIIDSIFINPSPTMIITADTNQGCVYRNFNLSAGASSGQFFFWDMGDGNNKSGRNINHTYASDGFYNIRLIAETSLGCKDTIFSIIKVYPKPNALFEYSPKDTCEGPVTVYMSNLTSGGTDYFWTFGNGLISNKPNPKTKYDGPGAYNIVLIANNQYGCKDSISKIYNVYKVPKASIEFTPNQGCQPLEILFKNTSLNGSSFLWYFGDGSTSNTENPKHTYSAPGIYDVKLIVTNGGICLDSIFIRNAITVHPKPEAAFDTALNILERPYRFMQFTNYSIGAVRYLWLFGDSRTSIVENPYHEFNSSGNYIVGLIAISDKGCTDTFYLTAIIPEYNKGLFVPNAFTPDYGLPEVRIFKPVGIELQKYSLRILNKWGELIWENSEIENGRPKTGWDGRDKFGRECPQGAYVWIVDAQFTDGSFWDGMVYPSGSQKPVTSGNVTLIR